MWSSNSDSNEERIQNIEKDLAAVQQTLKNIINSGGKNDQTASINDLFIKMMKLENEFDQANKNNEQKFENRFSGLKNQIYQVKIELNQALANESKRLQKMQKQINKINNNMKSMKKNMDGMDKRLRDQENPYQQHTLASAFVMDSDESSSSVE